MKGSRIVAVGLVVAAIGWVASGHLFPHETAQSRAAILPGNSEPKPFRVAVIDTAVAQHARKLILSGRTEADKKVTITARTGGILTELRVKRGQQVKKGEIIAVLSDDAREAQVAQATALFNQRKTELEARRKLIENGMMPKLEIVNLESQFKIGRGPAGTGHGRARPRRAARAVGRHHHRSADRSRRCRLLDAREPRSHRWLRSIRCWRSSKCRKPVSPA